MLIKNIAINKKVIVKVLLRKIKNYLTFFTKLDGQTKT